MTRKNPTDQRHRLHDSPVDEPQISSCGPNTPALPLSKAERLEDLINEFFDITRFNLTHLTLEEETVNLTRMLEQIAFEFQPVLAEKELTCETPPSPPDVQLICDPTSWSGYSITFCATPQLQLPKIPNCTLR